ncbi:MAG: hypothetical protein NW215_03810 [Hyphomicrobiales bacterium]|nr:hypothetical protein [Hyphomicrobiales bacterium]
MATNEKMRPSAGPMSPDSIGEPDGVDYDAAGGATRSSGGASMSGSTHGAQDQFSQDQFSEDQLSQDIRAAARSATASAQGTAADMAEAARRMGSRAQDAAASLAGQAKENVKGMLNEQVSAGADVIERISESTRTAAETLNETSPHLANFVRGAADRIEDFSRDIRDQTVDDLVRAASDYARRRPAVVFGAAAALGFIVLRMVKVNASEGRQSRSQASYAGEEDWSSRMGSTAGYGDDYARTDQFHGR